jgi:hypothetical protein
MLVRFLVNWLPRVIVLAACCLGLAWDVSAQTGPVFSSQAPISGIVGNTFTVFLPVSNTGTTDATNVQVTSVALGHMSPTNLSLPQSIGTLAVRDHDTLDFQFDATLLTVGAHYLLTVRGTYQLGAQILGFAVNRFVMPSPATGVLLTEIQHWMALDTLELEANALPGLDRDSDNAALLTFIRNRSDFVDSDIDLDSHSVWATFSDGRLIILGNDFNLTNSAPPSSTPGAVSAVLPRRQTTRQSPSMPVRALTMPSPQVPSFTPNELPHSSVVRVISGVSGVGWTATSTAIANISAWLTAQSYTQAPGADASVASLKTTGKTTGGEGVFFFITHGDMGGRNNRQYGLWTSTRAGIDGEMGLDTTGNPPGVTDADINGIPPNTPPTLITLLENEEFDLLTSKWRRKWHYAITAQFVQTYFQNFSQASFVFLVACNSSGAAAPVQTFQNALYKKNASVIAGWTSEVNVVKAPTTAQLIFDRLLGANQFALETLLTNSGEKFNQRPFDYISASNDMGLHDDCPNSDLQGDLTCGTDEKTNAILLFNQNSSLTAEHDIFGLLAPSIDQLLVDEGAIFDPPNNFFLTGIFGAEAGEVTVGGTPPAPGSKTTAMTGGRPLSTCFAWNAPRIACGDLPPSGDGSAGNVQVTIRGHNSNIAQLTYWQGVFHYVAAGADSLKETVDFNVSFRSDIREHRPVIHYPPVEPSEPPSLYPVQAIYPVSVANYACGGQGIYVAPFPGAIKATNTWNGSGQLILSQPPVSNPLNGFALGGQFQSHTDLLFNLTGGTTVSSECQFTSVILGDNGPVTVMEPLFIFFPDLTSGLTAKLDPQTATILVPIPPPTGSEPCQPLINEPCSSTLNWEAITPLASTAPDPASPR